MIAEPILIYVDYELLSDLRRRIARCAGEGSGAVPLSSETTDI